MMTASLAAAGARAPRPKVVGGWTASVIPRPRNDIVRAALLAPETGVSGSDLGPPS